MTTWNWLRLAVAISGGASILLSAVVPIAAPYLIPLGAGLIGVSCPTPGSSKQ